MRRIGCGNVALNTAMKNNCLSTVHLTQAPAVFIGDVACEQPALVQDVAQLGTLGLLDGGPAQYH